MRTRNGLLSSVALMLALVACAPVSKIPEIEDRLVKAEARKQRDAVVERTFNDMSRLHRIAYPILAANQDICGDKIAAGTGMYLGTKYFFHDDYRSAAKRRFGIDDELVIFSVIEGTPAGAAGLKQGDVILAVGDKEIAKGKSAGKDYSSFASQSIKEGKLIELKIRRDGEELNVKLGLEPVCKYGYYLLPEQFINAFADGEDIMFSSGMMQFAAQDTELATVVGHEIAHNLMGHITKGKANQTMGMVIDILIGGLTGINTGNLFQRAGIIAYSQEFETEADYVGLYLVARAGFEIDDSPNFWRRMGIQHPGTIAKDHRSSHPSGPERFVMLERTVEEIKAKLAAGDELKPEIHTPPTQPPETEDHLKMPGQ